MFYRLFVVVFFIYCIILDIILSQNWKNCQEYIEKFIAWKAGLAWAAAAPHFIKKTGA